MGSTPWRTEPLPPGWGKIRTRILRRDPTCQLRWRACTGTSTEVDHMNGAGDHSDEALQGVCSSCHKRKTSMQANAARIPRRRPPEPHPGELRR